MRPSPAPETPLTEFCQALLLVVMPCHEVTWSPEPRMPSAAALAAVTAAASTPRPPAVTMMYWPIPLMRCSRPAPPVMAALPTWRKLSRTRRTAPIHKVAGRTDASGPDRGSRLGVVRWSTTPKTPPRSEIEKSHKDFIAESNALAAMEPIA